MSEWMPATLLAIRAISHVLISLRVASYMASHDSRHRKGVAMIAALFVGCNMAEAIRIVLNFNAFKVNVEPYLPGVILMVLIFVIWSGGNVAKLLPRKLLERLP